MECAAKGICLNAGLPHSKLIDSRHNNLNLFLQFYSQILTQTQTAPYIDDILANYFDHQEDSKSESQLNRFLMLTTSPKKAKGLSREQREAATRFYTSALVLTPREVSDMLAVLVNIRKNKRLWIRAISQVTRHSLSLMPPDGGVTPDSLSKLLNRQILERLDGVDVSNPQSESNERIAKYFLETMMARLDQSDLHSQFEEMNWEYMFGKEDHQRILLGSFEAPVTFTDMLVVGSLVWPHESYTRYPASPQAIDRSFFSAAAKRQLGSGHYSSTVGVMAHIREISRIAIRITGSLKKLHDAGYLYSSLEDR